MTARRSRSPANLGSVADARLALVAGADGAGLVRTEFLFLDRSEPPSVEEQRTVYDELAEAMGGRRLAALRTWDVGGDKTLPFLPLPGEANPFLGSRGLRRSSDRRPAAAHLLAASVRHRAALPVALHVPDDHPPAEVDAPWSCRGAAPSDMPGGAPGTMIEVPAAALNRGIPCRTWTSSASAPTT